MFETARFLYRLYSECTCECTECTCESPLFNSSTIKAVFFPFEKRTLQMVFCFEVCLFFVFLMMATFLRPPK